MSNPIESDAPIVDSKEKRYAALVDERKRCRACAPELKNPSEENPLLDSDRIGPYSRWQGNLYSRILVIGEDFADVDTFNCAQGWPARCVQTNHVLVELLKEAKIEINLPQLGNNDDKLFFTNAVLCLKSGSMGSEISEGCFERCADKFLGRTIEIIRPKVVATLGKNALTATLRVFGYEDKRGLGVIVDSRQIKDLAGIKLFPMFHPSARVLQSKTRTMDKQKEDWRFLGQWLADNSNNHSMCQID